MTSICYNIYPMYNSQFDGVLALMFTGTIALDCNYKVLSIYSILFLGINVAVTHADHRRNAGLSSADILSLDPKMELMQQTTPTTTASPISEEKKENTADILRDRTSNQSARHSAAPECLDGYLLMHCEEFRNLF